MKLRDFLQDIALNELQGSSLVELTGYEISKQWLPKVIQALNESLAHIYTIFPLKESQVTVQVLDGITSYYLDSAYAMSNHISRLPKYIIDSEHQPFLDDVLLIKKVESDTGYRFGIDDDYNLMSVRIPEYNCIQLPSGASMKYFTVTYQATLPRIPLDTPLENNITINIPASIQSVVSARMASIIYNSLGGDNVELGNFYYGKFKGLIEELNNQGIGVRNSIGVEIRPLLRGWR